MPLPTGGGSWDTDAALDRVGESKEGTTPAASPGWTEYKKVSLRKC